ncbi:hypothetical protein [Bradyrhizobium sp. 17]|uniref:hypothetical protein n=1 Tax=Bradyrhizobium sp. 17 TaxID=2782649 RepID=UPI001FFBA081|nr:hypothetical protein [Bradyrhizobium sp. 17]MCK1525618.1 hypothetical protein [Bradyrhizobium sp. 17]
MSLEEILKAHQFTIAALGVLGTFAAVTVALVNSYMTARASRTNLHAWASINVVYHDSIKGTELPRYLVISIRNLGVMPVHIGAGFFHWKVPFQRQLYEVLPLDIAAGDEWAPQRKYPIEIKPRTSDRFFLSDLETFRQYSRQHFVGSSIWSRIMGRFLSAIIFTDEGKVFKVVLDKTVRKQLAAIRTNQLYGDAEA